MNVDKMITAIDYIRDLAPDAEGWAQEQIANDLDERDAEIEKLKEELRRVRARQIIQQTVEIERLRTWIENVATDEQLDAPVSALGGQTGRQLLGAFNTEEGS